MGKSAGSAALWVADQPATWHDESVGVLLAQRAAHTPTSPALHMLAAPGQLITWSYGELYQRASAAAGALLSLTEPGSKVAVCAPSSLEWLALEYGSAIAGMVLVPMNPAMGDPEFDHILRTSEARLVLCADSFRGQPLHARLGEVVAALPNAPGLVDLVTWINDARDGGSVVPMEDSSRPLLIQFTSGTTGRPKGAVLTHEAALNSAATWVTGWGQRSDDVFICPVPFHHVGASVSAVLGNLAIGSSMAFMPTYSPQATIELIEASGATVLTAVPTMLYDLQREPGFDPERLSTIRIIVGGGAAVPQSTVQDIESTFGVEFVVTYGQTESPSILQTRPGDPANIKAATLGRPLPGRDVRIADVDGGSTVNIDTVGEICSRSRTQMVEYLGMRDATASTVDADGWLHTGDLGAMDADGNVTFHGRARDLIIRGGENIYPDQVESAYASCPDIKGVAIIGKPDERYGEVPIGVVVLAAGKVLDPTTLEQYGRDRLASFKVPRTWLSVDEFPMTASGKVRKVELREQLLGDEPSS